MWPEVNEDNYPPDLANFVADTTESALLGDTGGAYLYPCGGTWCEQTFCGKPDRVRNVLLQQVGIRFGFSGAVYFDTEEIDVLSAVVFARCFQFPDFVDGADGKRVANSRTDYNYREVDGEFILDETVTYDISELSEEEKTILGLGEITQIAKYKGDVAGKEQLDYILSEFEDGVPTMRSDYNYKENGSLDFVEQFYVGDLSEEEKRLRGAGDLMNITFYEGARGREQVARVEEYNMDGELISVQEYEYEGSAARRRTSAMS